MAVVDDSLHWSENVEEIKRNVNISDDILDQRIGVVAIEYDDEAILAFNPALRDDIGTFPKANYCSVEDIELDYNDTISTNEETSSYSRGNLILNLSREHKSDTKLKDDNDIGKKLRIKNSLSCNAAKPDIHEARDIQTDHKPFMASGDMAFGCRRSVERLTRNIVAQIQSNIPQLDKLRQELSLMQADVKKLKEEFSEIDITCRKTFFSHSRLAKTAKSYMNKLDLVIYQNKVINHLQKAEKEMKLFECQVTPDRKVIFVDPDSFGTDVDRPTQFSSDQSWNLLESEIKRSNEKSKADDNYFRWM